MILLQRSRLLSRRHTSRCICKPCYQRFTMASTGMAMPLDDLIAADGDEGKAYIDDFLSGFMEDSYVDGKIYSIPFQRSTEILFYNKDAFKEVGLDPEKSTCNLG